MRGKHLHRRDDVRYTRITPADAGKTRGLGVLQRAHEDHPRGCGENSYTDVYSSASRGSPPRMRGKPRSHMQQTAPRRITPADAGKTFVLFGSTARAWDHPRGCGENSPFAVATRFLTGSPPRMRGKPVTAVGLDGKARITPADAGKTEDWKSKYEKEQDHPRGCGENSAASVILPFLSGSPPRMRGKRLLENHAESEPGITPADAGKTRHGQTRRHDAGDHPRGCGENAHRGKRRYKRTGSPPRMRGKQDRCFSAGYDCGITPADAGKTAYLLRLR